jgi:transcriptional regulator with XRE-family HTH domain
MEQVDPLRALFDRAKSHRVPMAEICRRAEIDPTTPSRWKRGKNGATLDKVDKLNAALADILVEQEARAA